jgi:hypothetical protein
MDVFIARENIRKLSAMLLIEQDPSQVQVLKELLERERLKLAAAAVKEARLTP